ncbi:MAG: 2-dehydropantoate 2-reductase [Bacteroidetes bacterium]|nr:2-dehydropantoate 2-reductase [Bacteroidota bacterium]
MKKIYIIGGGTIGRALAVVLQRHQRDVVLVRASQEAPAATEKIRVYLNDGSEIMEEVAVSSPGVIPVFDGVVVLTTKSYGNEGIAETLTGKTGRSPVVILQNGLGVEEPFLRAGFDLLYRCVLFATSQYKDKGDVTFKPVTASPIGVVEGRAELLEEIVAALHTPVFPFAASGEIRKIVWTKTIANCVFNSVCPLLETDNGVFHRNPEALRLAKEMIAECVAVAGLEGIRLSAEEVTERLLLISKSSDGQFISTLQDIRNKRPTEIDTLNFAIARAAAAKGREELAPITKALGELVRLKSGL